MEYKNVDKIIDFKKKYILLEDDIIEFNNKILYRIQAVKDFKTIEGDIIIKGQKGGYIESELNLSHFRNGWIYEEALVGGETRIASNTIIKKSKIFGFITIRNSIIENSNILTDFCFINFSYIKNCNIKNNFKIKNSKICNIQLENANCNILKNIEIKNNKEYFFIDFNDIFSEKKSICFSLGYELDKNVENKKTVIVNDDDIIMNYKDYMDNLKNIYSDKEVENIKNILNLKSNVEKLDVLFSKI